MAQRDTIVAIATANGKGGVGIVRLSGEKSFAIATRIFSPQKKQPEIWQTHQLVLGSLHSLDQDEFDHGYAVRMGRPNSYTGEDVVEFFAHGSPIVLNEIVRVAIEAGARLAEPGEFTKRAFLNGKVDLIQAEAVSELIQSESLAEAQSARLRLSGKLSDALFELREKTISVLAECEADVDFPEEELSLSGKPHLLKKLKEIQAVGSSLSEAYTANQKLHDGFRIALIGRPNVGKSSIFNALLFQERAIVTATPGTTRDVLREELTLNGRRTRLIDTAGIRSQGSDDIEKMGIQKSEEEATKADLILLVLDSKEGWTPEDEKLEVQFGEKEIWRIWNKIDLGRTVNGVRRKNLMVSAKTGAGIDQLKAEIGLKVTELAPSSSNGGISNDRQKGLLDRYVEALQRAESEFLRGASPEFIAFELREAYVLLSRLLGKDDSVEDILSEIFSKFCIGK